MRLYHFTSPDAVAGIKREGVVKGLVIIPPPHAPPSYRLLDPLPLDEGQPPGTVAVYGYTGQWLTDDPQWRQPWATRSTIPHDRTAYRARVGVPPGAPLLVHWPAFVREQRLEQRWPLWLADFEGQPLDDDDGAASGLRPDPGRWWVYLGRVPPGWLSEWTRRPTTVPAQEVA